MTEFNLLLTIPNIMGEKYSAEIFLEYKNYKISFCLSVCGKFQKLHIFLYCFKIIS